jgi:hypothetical protein
VVFGNGLRPEFSGDTKAPRCRAHPGSRRLVRRLVGRPWR